MFRRILLTLVILALGLGVALPSFAQGQNFTDLPGDSDLARMNGASGAVFVATNSYDEVRGNEVVMYRRAANGLLSLVGRFPTGGQGSGPGTRFRADGLGSANSVVLSKNNQWLFVVNGGDDSVSVFRVHEQGLDLRDHVHSGGIFPNSVTVRNNLVYVLNAANEGNITAFRMDGQGKLAPIDGSTRTLDANQTFPPDALFDPAGISFTPDGRQLVVTIKDGPAIPEATGKGRILIFNLDNRGLPGAAPVVYEGDNNGPFGFDFDKRGNLLVADFVGGPELTGAASSYKINPDGSLTVISNNVADGQIDTCWLVTNGNYAYGSNFGTDNISSWVVGDDGSLTLLAAEAAHTDAEVTFPLDLAVTPNGKFLYLVQPGNGKVGMWAINDDGSLTSLGAAAGLEPTADTEPPVYFTHLGGSPAGIAAY
jgi:6-phosphogluconolactonase